MKRERNLAWIWDGIHEKLSSVIATSRRKRSVLLVAGAWVAAIASVISVRALWSDEALSVRFADLPWAELCTIVRRFDPTFAMYYILLHVWIARGSSDVWDRFLSVFFATLTLPVVFRLAERIFDRRVAIAVCGALAVQTPFVHEAAEARPYALMTLGFALTMSLWYDASTNGRRYAGVFVAAVATIYAHVMTLLGLVALACASALPPRPARTVTLRLLIVGVCVAVATVPLAWLIVHAQTPQDHWEHNPNSIVAAVQLLAATVSGTIRILPLAIVLMATGFVASVRSGKRREGTMLVVLVALPIVELALASLVRPLFVPRYLAFVSVPEALLMGRGLVAAYDARAWRYAAVAAAAYLAVVGVASARRLTGDGYDWGAVANVVRANVRPDDGFALEPAYEFPPLRLALGDRLAGHVVFPQNDDLPAILQSSERIDARRARRMPKTFARFWLVRVVRQSTGPLAEPVLTVELARAYRLAHETRIPGDAGDIDVDLFERRPQPAVASPGNASSRA
jgi:mannosyltransferase